MNVNKVNASYLNYQPVNRVNDVNTQNTQNVAPGKDQIQISEEAKLMSEKVSSDNRINEIKEKIDNKFYFSDEVTNYVASALLKDVNAE